MLEPFLSLLMFPKGPLRHTPHTWFQLGRPGHSGRVEGDPDRSRDIVDTEKCSSSSSSPRTPGRGKGCNQGAKVGIGVKGQNWAPGETRGLGIVFSLVMKSGDREWKIHGNT